MKLSPKRLNELLEYDMFSGVVLRRKSKKELKADFDGMCSIYDPETRRTTKLKLNSVIYSLVHGCNLLSNERILHRNMQEDDFRLCNLVAVDRKLYILIKEAYRNVMHAIKMKQHPTDQHCYIVQWYEDGILKNKLVEDVVPAKRLVLKLKLKYSKILTKYCVFD